MKKDSAENVSEIIDKEPTKTIPVSPGRIITNGRHVINISASLGQYVLFINIKSVKNKGEKDKFITVICSEAYLNYSDHEYGLCNHG
ncbi:hypothetical protein GLOIN_2v1469500 [Rhizophagus clarus]|uniref:Uncharacterized protein n=1 Tax=Rhizophagus clarus TaxID=94130 RepID=A0A8H3M009_9GLOM|nr:hypothetical protein GLOIN_2v1469500 [Rhizophagus clarus]